MASHRNQDASARPPVRSDDNTSEGGWWIDGNWYPPGFRPTTQTTRSRARTRRTCS